MEALSSKGGGKKIQEEHGQGLEWGYTLLRMIVGLTYDRLDGRSIFTWEVTIGL